MGSLSKDRKTYLGILRERNRSLYVIVLTFMVVTMLVTVSRNEMTPIFVWSMYAGRSPVTDTFATFELQYNDHKVFHAPHTWKDHKRMMFFYSADQYAILHDNGMKDPDEEKVRRIAGKAHIPPPPLHKLFPTRHDMDNYPAWLKRYMQANLGEKIDSLKVYRNWMSYDKDGRVLLRRRELLCEDTR